MHAAPALAGGWQDDALLDATHSTPRSLIAELFDGGDEWEVEQLLAIARGDGHGELPLLDVGGQMHGVGIADHGRIRPDDDIADDYDESQWQIVLALRSVCQDAIREGINPHKRDRAIRWLFVKGDAGRTGAARGRGHPAPPGSTFDECCAALGARGWVIQSLVQHLWYLRDMPLRRGLPLPKEQIEEHGILPGPLEDETIYHRGVPGARVGEIVWQYPGIERIDALDAVVAMGVESEDAIEATDYLLERGLLGLRGTRLHFTSRPAMIRRSGRIGWARAFAGD